MSAGRKDDIVATGEALKLAAQWLGTDEKEVTEQANQIEEPSFAQFSGLGYKKHKVPKTKRKSVWKVDEHLTEKLSHSTRQHSRKHQNVQKMVRASEARDPVGEEEEEMGRSKMFSSPKERTSRRDLLVVHKKKKKK